jgi:glycine hydroxymethyltransferase
MTPGGVRIGTPAVTTRGLKENDMRQVGEFLHRTVQICQNAQNSAGKNLKQFLQAIEKDNDLSKLAKDVEVKLNSYPRISRHNSISQE